MSKLTSSTIKTRKHYTALVLIGIFAILIFTLPPAIIGKNVKPILAVSALVMLSIYLVLSFEIIHRGSLALLGAIIIIAAAIALGAIKPEESFRFVLRTIDFNTIGLLLGMMIIVAILGETGIFYWVGIKASRLSKGNPWKLMLILCTFTAVVSMFIDNVTTILLMVPVTLSVVRILKLRSPIPFILSQVLMSNVGGAATLIGDPPNIIIGSAANIDFNSFIFHMGPVVIILFAVSMISLKYFFFRNDLKTLSPTPSRQGQRGQQQQEEIESKEEERLEELGKKVQYAHQPADDDGLKEQLQERDDSTTMIKDRSLLKKSMIVLIGVIVLFVMQGTLHLEVSMIALGGAAVLLVITRAPLEKVLHEVDWATLVFFIGLFIIVGVTQEAGLIKLLSNAAINITGGNPWLTFVMMIWLSGIGSAFVDNIPFTATMIPVIQSLNANPTIAAAFGSNFHFSPLWWALALGADLGGNGTLIGSSAGIIAVGLSEKFGYPLSFGRWFKIGFPFMIITLAIGTVILPIFIVLGY